MTKYQIPRIVVQNLNKLRWLYLNQSFTSNILYPNNIDKFEEVKRILSDNEIPFMIYH